MDHLPLTAKLAGASMEGGAGGRVVDTYKKTLATAASVAAYAMLARGMARELLPEELRAAVRWVAASVRARLGAGGKDRHTIVIRRHFDGGYSENQLFEAARTYLATKIDPRAMRRLCLARSRHKEPDGSSSWSTLLCMEDGGSTTDSFEGVEFKWTSVETSGDDGGGKKGKSHGSSHRAPRETLELSFDAQHTDAALERYVPFIMSAAEQLQRRDRALKIFMNEGRAWHGINHHHPATFDTLAMDPALKTAVVDDLDRFLKRKEYYQRIGKAWKRGYLLYGPPGTGKSSLVAAMANYLRFNLYDLDLSEVRLNSTLQRLLIGMPNKSILVIEDIDCCFDAKSREDSKMPMPADAGNSSDDDGPPSKACQAPQQQQNLTLSGLLNFIDGLWSTSGEERIIVFTTNYKDRLDPALLRPGRMDMHVYMGHCGWEAFRTLARNYHLVDDHALFPEIQGLLAAVEVTPAEASEMLLRSEDADIALRVLTDFLQDKRRRTRKEASEINIDTAEKAMWVSPSPLIGPCLSEETKY
ncbi:AAA-ATPase At3g50940 [Brachypodium distachyon]|nr:AAA-ATPase At3g50940 [Brachypodium distachyon]|eukprot:XP_003560144.1 AAA-ATPase At3g50940 [Brachypodium distachyon]